MDRNSLFQIKDLQTPLASRLRPSNLDEFYGQQHLVGQGQILRRLIEADQIPSMIFYGPPGVGKTTLASIIAESTHAQFINFSAVTSSIKDIKEVMAEAEKAKLMGCKTILFVDEIHRFNKAQQDAFLPYVEKGSIILIGATTENPSFEVNSALLSRCKVFVLKELSKEDIVKVLVNAISNEKGFGKYTIDYCMEDLDLIAFFSNGDARTALNTLEMVVLNGKVENEKIIITRELIEQCTSKKALLYDKDGEEHYNLISALHKSMRNSDPDAAIYWLARMLEAGEDPLYVARRLIRFASEDVGIADSNALRLATSVYDACHDIGMPECSVNLAHCVVYLSVTAKSNSLYTAYEEAKKDAVKMMAEPVPLNIRNGVTKLMKEWGYGDGYQYAHDYENHITKMTCLPESLKDKEYYRPSNQGNEAKVKERVDNIRKWRKSK